MSIFRKTKHTYCSGNMDPTCENAITKNAFPPFRKNCPRCGSKSTPVVTANWTTIAATTFAFVAAAAVGYWQIQSTASSFLQSLLSKVVRNPTASEYVAPNPTPPNNPDRALEKLQESLRAQDYSAIVTFGNQVLQSHPDNVTTLNNVASAALKIDKLPMAKALLEKAISLQPNDPYLRYNLACVHARAGNKQEAVQLLHNACELGLAPTLFQQDTDLRSLHGFPAFDRLVTSKQCK